MLLVEPAAQRGGGIPLHRYTGDTLLGLDSAFCDGTSRYGVPENLTTG